MIRLASRWARVRMGWNASATTAAAIAVSSGLCRFPTAVPTPTTRATYTSVMNAASVPNTTVLLMTKSISYRRYFINAMTMATHRNMRASVLATCAVEVPHRTLRLKVTATSAAAVTNHFSWRRSSPRDRLYLRARETNAAINHTGMATSAAMNGTRAIAAIPVVRWVGPNGFDQFAAAKIIAPTVRTPMKIPMAQATGRHRGEESSAVGNRSSRKIKRVTGMVQIQFDTH